MSDAQSLTVFQDSSPEDVSHARRLWSSLSLLPPQESRLVSADVSQRLPVSRPAQRRSAAAAAGASAYAAEPHALVAAREEQRREERRKYEALAQNRRNILELLRKQREQRIQKEALSAVHRPGAKRRDEPERDRDSSQCEHELVLQLP